ncbi:ferredoxin [Saccharopolyspora sp. HNM0983]|uniref:Ferredoxin n=1 Tax=Saccharopolyspora montiporae TaxID=2781240 RepID=A0A929FYE2_9PSEU|nr:ferredoxin [Saccharopolyspora sp. HNM0983]MBE9373299.1 ferredoxin [Saccharopolyspora sp. HNM0983]
MKITIDTATCSGHARCAATAPEVYELDESGFALPIDDAVPDALADEAREGAMACPERAIRVEESGRKGA